MTVYLVSIAKVVIGAGALLNALFEIVLGGLAILGSLAFAGIYRGSKAMRAMLIADYISTSLTTKSLALWGGEEVRSLGLIMGPALLTLVRVALQNFFGSIVLVVATNVYRILTPESIRAESFFVLIEIFIYSFIMK